MKDLLSLDFTIIFFLKKKFKNIWQVTADSTITHLDFCIEYAAVSFL